MRFYNSKVTLKFNGDYTSFCKDRLTLKENKKNLIIFIHGFTSNANKTWKHFSFIINQDKELLGSNQVYFFNYLTKMLFLPLYYKVPPIQDIAESLKTHIDNKYPDVKEIFIVCHSMGGLIGRKLVLDDIQANNETKIKKMLLFAVPNTGSELANFGNVLLPFNRQLSQIKRNSDFLENLNKGWKLHDIEKKIRIKYIYGSLDNVVAKDSSTFNYAESECLSNCNHFNIVKTTDNHDIIYQIFKNFLNLTNTNINLTDEVENYRVDINVNISQYLEIEKILRKLGFINIQLFGKDSLCIEKKIDTFIVSFGINISNETRELLLESLSFINSPIHVNKIEDENRIVIGSYSM